MKTQKSNLQTIGEDDDIEEDDNMTMMSLNERERGRKMVRERGP